MKIVLTVSIFALIFYILIIIIVPKMTSSLDYFLENTTSNYSIGTIQQFSFGQSVSVKIIRPRFYGTIYEQEGSHKLYLFNLIPLPLKNNNIKFLKFHLIFVVSLIIFLLANFINT